MTQYLIHFSSRLKEQAVAMAIFAIMFASLGYFLPRIYYQYLDKTVYYQVDSPAQIVKEEYKACQSVEVRIHRKSLIDLKGDVNMVLFLRTVDGKTKYNEAHRDLVASKGETNVTAFWPLPCTIPSGIYYFDVVTSYQLNGIIKQTFWTTETFKVVAVEEEKVASPSGEL